MKYPIHYILEYRLVSGGGLNRGEIGGLGSCEKFLELEDAIFAANKRETISPAENIYGGICIERRQALDGQMYHLESPKIFKMNFRLDMRSLEFRKNKKLPSTWEKWTHMEGDSYEIKSEYFNLKEKKMEYYSRSCENLKEAFGIFNKYKDNKTRILSDWTLYSKNLVAGV